MPHEIPPAMRRCMERQPALKKPTSRADLPWNEDAPEGLCWKCPKCQSKATLGGNAAFHALKTGHPNPILVEFRNDNHDHHKTPHSEPSVWRWIDGNDRICFTIPGIVMGKPRMTRRDKWAKRPCVMRYWAWKDAARAHVPELPSDPIEVSWTAWLPFPKSYSKKKRAELSGQPHRQKPDRDNIDKGLLDFLFDNDSGIAIGTTKKLWEDERGPRMDVQVA